MLIPFFPYNFLFSSFALSCCRWWMKPFPKPSMEFNSPVLGIRFLAWLLSQATLLFLIICMHLLKTNKTSKHVYDCKGIQSTAAVRSCQSRPRAGKFVSSGRWLDVSAGETNIRRVEACLFANAEKWLPPQSLVLCSAAIQYNTLPNIHRRQVSWGISCGLQGVTEYQPCAWQISQGLTSMATIFLACSALHLLRVFQEEVGEPPCWYFPGLLLLFRKGRRMHVRRHQSMSGTWSGNEAKAAPVSCSVGGDVFRSFTAWEVLQQKSRSASSKSVAPIWRTEALTYEFNLLLASCISQEEVSISSNLRLFAQTTGFSRLVLEPCEKHGIG